MATPHPFEEIPAAIREAGSAEEKETKDVPAPFQWKVVVKPKEKVTKEEAFVAVRFGLSRLLDTDRGGVWRRSNYSIYSWLSESTGKSGKAY